jgi:hypothetical protein
MVNFHDIHKKEEDMNEKEQAIQIAKKWLEFDFGAGSMTQFVYGDPDCNACILARQFTRAIDRERLNVAMVRQICELLCEILENIPADEHPMLDVYKGGDLDQNI